MPIRSITLGMALTRDEAKRRISAVSRTLCEHVILLLMVDPEEQVVPHWASEVAGHLNNCVDYATSLKKSKDLDATTISGLLMSYVNAQPARFRLYVDAHIAQAPTRLTNVYEHAERRLHRDVHALVTAALTTFQTGGSVRTLLTSL